jgi:hypothetical protein
VTADQVVLAAAGTLAIVSALAALVVTRPPPRSLLDVLYLAVPVLGVILLVSAVAGAL